MPVFKTLTELQEIFIKANDKFLLKNKYLLTTQISERALCGALMLAMNDVLMRRDYKDYYIDVEYNRNEGRVKTIINENFKIITINCDLILHSRGNNKWQDNLIALEMKKSERPEIEKQSDRERLMALTKNSDGVWSADGIALPEHVCGYVLGVYYEVIHRSKEILMEFYNCGVKYFDRRIHFDEI